MKLTSLLQLVDKLQQAGKINNFQQACDVLRNVSRRKFERKTLTHCRGHVYIQIAT